MRLALTGKLGRAWVGSWWCFYDMLPYVAPMIWSKFKVPSMEHYIIKTVVNNIYAVVSPFWFRERLYSSTPKQDSIHRLTENAEFTEWKMDTLANQATIAGFSMILNKCIFQWFSINVSTRSPLIQVISCFQRFWAFRHK